MENILTMKNISKVYPNGVIANLNVDFSLKRGEIHALVGENGAGKSTLMKILFGLESETQGEISYENSIVSIKTPLDAIERGIYMVHQHFMLIPSMSVAENIVLGKEPSSFGFINYEEAERITKEISEQYNFKVNPKSKIEDISVGLKQKVEILKALYRGAKLLILDEPTAVLTPQETAELFSELKYLKEKGHTIVFISHKLNEIQELCDRVTIMKKGRSVGVYNVSEISKEEMSNLMVGHEFSWELDKKPSKPQETVLRINNAIKINEQDKAVLSGVSLSLRKGEILGVVGVEGNGQSELVEGITGLKPFSLGELIINGKILTNDSIRSIRKAGLVYIPEDRMQVGSVVDLSIKDNMISTFIDSDSFSDKGIMKNKEINKWVDDKIEEFSILAKDRDVSIGSLSGGNIQKVVVSREVSNNAQIIIADQPTRGIDIGAAKFIHEKLVSLRDQGAAILLTSADLTEVINVSDRLIVMYEGKIVANFENLSLVTEQLLGRYMLGLEKQSDEEIGASVYE